MYEGTIKEKRNRKPVSAWCFRLHEKDRVTTREQGFHF